MFEWVGDERILTGMKKDALVRKLINVQEMTKDLVQWNPKKGQWEVKPVFYHAQALQATLKEALDELCHSDGTEDDFRCRSMGEGSQCMAEDGKCFVKAWRKVLEASYGKEKD